MARCSRRQYRLAAVVFILVNPGLAPTGARRARITTSRRCPRNLSNDTRIATKVATRRMSTTRRQACRGIPFPDGVP